MTSAPHADYLKPCRYIDSTAPPIVATAAELSEGLSTDEAIARACFHFVRDEIQHSWDYQQDPVTCAATDTLFHRTGYCYAKSHLLCALLRASGIPCGLCYQRLLVDEGLERYCLHGLNAVFLSDYRWYRVDPRGNKPGVDAQFCPPVEQLAFTPNAPGEANFPQIFAEPLTVVARELELRNTYRDVYENLPDIDPVDFERIKGHDE